MHHLILCCNPSSSSFNNALADSLEAISAALGHETRIRNLYALGFDPVLRQADLDAQEKGSPAPEIAFEQQFILWADLLSLVYPVWWTGMPALLKGYLDRVFSKNFAYRLTDTGTEGLLTGKRVLIFNTTGAPSTTYADQDMHETMAKIMDQGIFEPCGMEVLHHAFFGGMHAATPEIRKSYLAEAESIASRYL